jgi:hypothetical protein
MRVMGLVFDVNRDRRMQQSADASRDGLVNRAVLSIAFAVVANSLPTERARTLLPIRSKYDVHLFTETK